MGSNISEDKSEPLVLNGKGHHLCFRSKTFQTLTEKKSTQASLLQEIMSSGFSLLDLFASQSPFKLEFSSEKQDKEVKSSCFGDQEGFHTEAGPFSSTPGINIQHLGFNLHFDPACFYR